MLVLQTQVLVLVLVLDTQVLVLVLVLAAQVLVLVLVLVPKSLLTTLIQGAPKSNPLGKIRYLWTCSNFYRAMHFSAKRGIAIACRLSVRL